MKIAAPLALVLLALVGVYFVGYRHHAEPATLYDWAGVLPANCQQLIKQGVAAYHAKTASAEQVLSAFEEHCGENGALGWKSGAK